MVIIYKFHHCSSVIFSIIFCPVQDLNSGLLTSIQHVTPRPLNCQDLPYSLCFSSAVAPIIAEIVEREYNTSDSITCSADGIPTPRVTWAHISGSMPQTVASGSGKAVLMNLEDGDHVWMCTATNEEGTVTVNVSFTGAFCCLLLFDVFSRITSTESGTG